MKSIVVFLIVGLMTTASFGYFVDDFERYAPLNPRWTVDTDPYNIDNGGGFFYTRSSDGLAMMDGDAGAWLHLEDAH